MTQPAITDPAIDAKIQEFYDVQQLIKNLEAVNKRNRATISEMVCCDKYRRQTAESAQDGWCYYNQVHCCTVRSAIRHYIDKEQLPRDVYQMYGQLQEIVTLSVSKSADAGDAPDDVTLDLDGVKCTYSPIPKRRARPNAT